MTVLNYNQMIIAGRLTADPALANTANGTAYVRFSVAIDRRYLSTKGDRITDFFDCVAWRSQAEFIAKYFKKGSPIYLVGEMQNNNYTDNNGKKRYGNVLSVNEVRMIEYTKDDKPDIPPEDQVPDDEYIPSEPPF